jgi:hypothetical protein
MSRLRGRTKTVAVLGCGPAGLFAALAARRKGYRVDIYSRKVRSGLYGAQYLHAPIPDLGSDHRELISYSLNGTSEGYARKVYGEGVVAADAVSPSSLNGIHYAWDIRSAYREAWELFEDDIVDVPTIRADDVTDLLGWKTYARMISSIPMEGICHDRGHNFVSQAIWASGDCPDQQRYAPFRVTPWTVVCDGTDDVSWYRASNVFGHATVEWAREDKPPVENVSRVVKPISTNCTCHQGLIRVGRYGEWKKGVLSHEAYFRTLEAL